jgi:hypothetical protein
MKKLYILTKFKDIVGRDEKNAYNRLLRVVVQGKYEALATYSSSFDKYVLYYF